MPGEIREWKRGFFRDTFDRILEQTPAVFAATQLRLFLRLVVYIDPYSFLEEVASHFAGDGENHEQTAQEIVLSALGNTADEKLTSFALRLALTDHQGLPRDTASTCSPKPRPYSLHPTAICAMAYEMCTSGLFGDDKLVRSYRTILVLDRVKVGLSIPL